MPGRGERSQKHKRWSFYFQPKPNGEWSRSTLLKVVAKSQAKVTSNEVSNCRIDCVWREPVTYQSAARFVTLAREKLPSFQMYGLPMPTTDEAGVSKDEAASAAQLNYLVVNYHLTLVEDAGPQMHAQPLLKPPWRQFGLLGWLLRS